MKDLGVSTFVAGAGLNSLDIGSVVGLAVIGAIFLALIIASMVYMYKSRHQHSRHSTAAQAAAPQQRTAATEQPSSPTAAQAAAPQQHSSHRAAKQPAATEPVSVKDYQAIKQAKQAVSSKDLGQMQELLLYSAAGGHVGAVEVLLKNPGIDVNKRRDHEDKESPLIAAVAEGHVGVVEMLLAHRDIDVNQALKGSPLLHIAIFGGHVEILERLLNHSRIDTQLRDFYGDGETPLDFIDRMRDGDVDEQIKVAMKKLLEKHDQNKGCGVEISV